MIFDNILDVIGRTPLVKLHRVGEHLDCNLYAKCEFLNPGGSVKDRIGYQMVLDAEAQGRIKPGDTLIEPTSGNTGIGLALAGAVRGYRVIITLPEKMSREKQVVLEALGAEIIRTPTEAAWDSPDSHIGVAKTLQTQIPNAHILDQYSNPSNPNVHYERTGQEILDDLNGKVDMIVIGAGTGGTISGVARKIKEECPNCIVVGADPVGSILAGGDQVGTYKVEGIGYDFIPDVLDRKLVDTWVKTNDGPSFQLARQLIREEGLLCGGSSGSALYAVLKEAAKLKKGQNCVVILADGVRNYMTKFVDDKWMRDNRFSGAANQAGTVDHVANSMPKRNLITIGVADTASEAASLMRKEGISQLPVVDGKVLVGLLTEDGILQYLASGQQSRSTLVRQIMNRSVSTVEMSSPISTLNDELLKTGSVVVIDKDRQPVTILTKIDLVEYLIGQDSKEGAAV
ncbi:MAG: cystathionine beta-synthase [Candidatus Eisenbacteria bacterium]|uniref:Cystathionine beta-synthase n=1 Tax=Eiseniibacteriota bacterium TaxID=2212470 RepID=A0A956SFM7_UNCEI|nr:cystathionine beta-synthase [Candidatus Eisenbacteria bacterium]